MLHMIVRVIALNLVQIFSARVVLSISQFVEFQRREKRKAFIMIVKDYIQRVCMQGYIETCRGITEGKLIN